MCDSFRRGLLYVDPVHSEQANNDYFKVNIYLGDGGNNDFIFNNYGPNNDS